MKRYLVAKTPTSGFISQLTIDEVIARLRANEIKGDYVATESTGPSFAELVKRTDVQWEPVSQLVARTHLPETSAPQIAEAQTFPNIGSRYGDAYLVARATATIGAAVKVIGVALGLLIVFVGVIAGSRDGGGAQFFIGGVLLGVTVAIPIFVLGVLVSAHGQVLKATLDTAVHSSPFLSKEDMARVMSL